jgi:hypothetical protein
MAKIVNLRSARKAKARVEKRARADANAAQHGETRADRQRRKAEAELSDRRLDGHRREE